MDSISNECQIFVKRVMKMEPRTLTTSAFDCIEKLFLVVNTPLADAPPAPVEEQIAMVGIDFIWTIGLEVWIIHVTINICIYSIFRITRMRFQTELLI